MMHWGAEHHQLQPKELLGTWVLRGGQAVVIVYKVLYPSLLGQQIMLSICPA